MAKSFRKRPAQAVACFVLVALTGLVQNALVNVNEIKAMLLAVRLEDLKPTCQPGFEKCAWHLKTIEPMLESLQNNWSNFTSIECVSRALSNGFPSNSWDCWKNGEFGQTMICMLSSGVKVTIAL
ncbi:uncharacterized protein LOC144096932 [Amblyomma americanum]